MRSALAAFQLAHRIPGMSEQLLRLHSGIQDIEREPIHCVQGIADDMMAGSFTIRQSPCDTFF